MRNSKSIHSFTESPRLVRGALENTLNTSLSYAPKPELRDLWKFARIHRNLYGFTGIYIDL